MGFNYGDLTTVSMPNIQEEIKPSKFKTSDRNLGRNPCDSAVNYVTIIMANLGDGTYPFVDGLFYGLKPLWDWTERDLSVFHENQVAFLHNGTMYMASGDPTSTGPMMVQDLTEISQAREAETSQICHGVLEPGQPLGLDARLVESTVFRAVLLGDETFMVHIGHTNINVWCFDENVPLANEVVAYGREAKRRADERAWRRKWGSPQTDMPAVPPGQQVPLMDPAPLGPPEHVSRTSSMQVFPSTSPAPTLSPRNTDRESLAKKDMTPALKEMRLSPHPYIPNAEKRPSSNKPRESSKPTKRIRKRFSLRRGIYKLVVKVVGQIL